MRRSDMAGLPTRRGAARRRWRNGAGALVALSALACGSLEPLEPAGPTGGGGLGGDAGVGGAELGGGGATAGGGGADGGADGGYGGSGYGGALVCDGPGAIFVTDVVETHYGSGQDYGQGFMPEIVHGPPQGGGCCTGSLDVVSLGNGGSIVVGFAGNGIVDGPGVDFVVFENAFETGGTIFAELATVEVSSDGERWHAFPCEAVEPPWGSCAGHHPVYLDGATLNEDESFDPVASGGDGYDLSDIGVSEARWIRITDRPDLDGFSGVFDLDAVGIVNAACP